MSWRPCSSFVIRHCWRLDQPSFARTSQLVSGDGLEVYSRPMDWNLASVMVDEKFLGIHWDFWKVLGWVGNGLFTSRFFVQWWATERHKRVVVPPAFWWLSMAGSGCLLIYGIHKRDSVFIFAYLFTWIPYIRNLMI